MRFPPFLILLCLYLYKCSGSPPGRVSTRIRGVNFSPEEDDFIVEELTRLFVDNQHIFSNALWKKIADKHRKKCLQETPGFRQERSWTALRSRLRRMANFENPHLNTKVPQHIKNAVRQDLNKSSRVTRVPFTPEEQNFIIEELSQPSHSSPFATSTLQDIQAKHELKFRSQTPGFGNLRTVNSVRWNIHKMKDNGELPEEVVKKIKIYEKGSKSRASSSNQQTTLEDSDAEEDEEDEDE